MKRLSYIFLALLVFAIIPAAAIAQVIPTNSWTDFHGSSTTTFNGQQLVAGSIIDAYDPQNVHCGRFTVTTPGEYGFMPVYGDDGTTPLVDEGAELNDVISFKINGRDALVTSGDNTWTDQTIKQVELSATATIAISAVVVPADTAILPDQTFKVSVAVRNDGDGIDFYGVSASNSQPDFGEQIPTVNIYANPGQTVETYFYIVVPAWVTIPNDTVSTVSWEVFSKNDITKKVTGTFDVAMTVNGSLDADDNPGTTLPVAFELNQNYPNPFNPTTTISFSLPAKSSVSLEIYDILGRYVEVRDLGTLPAGTHDFEYDASAQASGVYFYRIVTETAALSRKMILVK